MKKPYEVHNEVVGKIVSDIVRPIFTDNVTPTQTLVLLESVITGVFLAIVKLDGDEPVVAKLAENVKLRLAEIRLRDVKPEGKA